MKLARGIVINDGVNFHINIDGEDVGRFEIDAYGNIKRFSQPKGAHKDDAGYFNPIKNRLKELNKFE